MYLCVHNAITRVSGSSVDWRTQSPIKLREIKFYRSRHYRMSNTTKTELVAGMKWGNTEKEDNAQEGRNLRSRRVNYPINKKTAVKKKIKSCREVPLQIKMEKGNNLRVFCSTTAFENIRKIIIETIASNYTLDI